MAKTTKKKSGNATKPEDIEDAIEVTDEDRALESSLESTEGDETVSQPDETGADEKVSEENQTDTDPVIDDVETVDAASETASQPTEPVNLPPAIPPQQVTVQKVGFVPLVGGGLIAGGLGFAAAWFGMDQGTDLAPQVTEQAAQIESLQSDLAALPAAAEMPDLAPLQASIEEIRSQTSEGLTGVQSSLDALDARVSGFESTLAETDTRLTAVERAPSEDGGVTETAISSFEREIAGLREEITAQESRIQSIADGAAADLAAAQEQLAQAEAQAQAAAEEAQAEAQAAEAEAQAALAAVAVAELKAAIDSGAPLEAEIAQLAAAGIEVPEALQSVAADGVPTAAALQSDFPGLARAALETARSEGLADQDAGGLTSFFRNQFDVRSVEPREGDDPDAVLSRAEAALRQGDLDRTLSELSALPEPVQATFADWLASAEARAAAIAAADTLAPSDSN